MCFTMRSYTKTLTLYFYTKTLDRRDKEALGVAPAAYWFTSKYNTDLHPPSPDMAKEEL